MQCVKEALRIVDEAKQLGDFTMVQEGVGILEQIVKMMEEKRKEHDILFDRIERLTRRLGG